MIRVLALVALTCGCHNLFGLVPLHGTDGGADDVAIVDDAPVPIDGALSDAMNCYGQYGMGTPTGLLRVCLSSSVPPTLDISGIVNTDSDPRCIAAVQPGSPSTPVCVIAATT